MEKSENKTPENVAKAVSKFKKNHIRKPISIDFYLDDPKEKEFYEMWKDLKNKKQFVMDALQQKKNELEAIK